MVDDAWFRSLYDRHEAYLARRDVGSFSAQRIILEARDFKVPNLLTVLPRKLVYSSVIEIGCATGEVLNAFPDHCSQSGAAVRKIGFDISPENIASARERYPHISFSDLDFSTSGETADIVVLSDILEHVADDADFLYRASRIGKYVLLNLPLEVNWTNRSRVYGIDDPSGHLRAYTLEDGLSLVFRAGLKIIHSERIWSHETDYDVYRRRLRKQMLGAAYTGKVPVRMVKSVIHRTARTFRPFGRRLYPSNLFLSANR